MPLLDPTQCVLLVIDAQPGFLDDAARDALDRARWLTTLAAKLGVPIVVTEEDATRNGPTDAELVKRLPAGTPVLDKPTFGVTGSPHIMEAISATGRRTAVLVGFETDVCIAQSAVGLVEQGFRAIVVEDATSSPGPMHERGLARARRDGAERDHAKGIAYEWVRSVQASRDLIDADPDLNPAPFAL
jgi:nicotinamidase-related amidase